MNPTILQTFVVLEGLDGSGTTTQLHLLEERLAAEGRPHWTTFEPTDGAVGRLIRSILEGSVRAHPATIAMLYAADRNEHIHAPDIGIEAHVSHGEIVVSDRYMFSSLAYQSLECDPAFVQALNASFPLPSRLIFLDTPVEVCQERLSRRGKTELFDGCAFQRRVRDSYLECIEGFRTTGMHVSILDGDRPAGIIHGDIWKILSEMPIKGV